MKTLIFDFDGTLADSFELVVDIAYGITGIPKLSDEKVAELRRLPLMKARKALGIPLTQIPRIVFLGRKAMQERIGEVLPFPGIREVLDQLKEEGYHMLVMSSNSEGNVRHFLRTHDLEHYFDGVYGGIGVFDKAGAIKRVMKRNHLNKAESYYIGDEVRDAVSAQKVGIHAVSVSWGYQAREALEEHKPYAIADKPVDLPKIFASDGQPVQ